MSVLFRLGLVGFSLALAGAASAATLNEADVSGGFSSDWASPTQITGFSSVIGTTGQNNHDIFRVTLQKAVTTVTLTFGAGGRMQDSYSAGSTVMFSSEAFPWGWAGMSAGSVQIDSRSQNDKSITLQLDEAFGPVLYLALYNTHGVMDYTISGIGPALPARTSALPVSGPEAAPAPVPVPAAGLMLGIALFLGALGGVFRRRSSSF